MWSAWLRKERASNFDTTTRCSRVKQPVAVAVAVAALRRPSQRSPSRHRVDAHLGDAARREPRRPGTAGHLGFTTRLEKRAGNQGRIVSRRFKQIPSKIHKRRDKFSSGIP